MTGAVRPALGRAERSRSRRRHRLRRGAAAAFGRQRALGARASRWPRQGTAASSFGFRAGPARRRPRRAQLRVGGPQHRRGRASRELGASYALAPRAPTRSRSSTVAVPSSASGGPRWRARSCGGRAGMHLFSRRGTADPGTARVLRGVIVAPNGVEAPHDIEWDGGSGGYVLWMGRFDPEHKGIDLLVRAVASVPAAARPQLRLHGPDGSGGKARCAGSCTSWARAVGLGPRRCLRSREVGDALPCGGLRYPSRWEGFGNSVAEAASIGVPTVVTPYTSAGSWPSATPPSSSRRRSPGWRPGCRPSSSRRERIRRQRGRSSRST